MKNPSPTSSNGPANVSLNGSLRSICWKCCHVIVRPIYLGGGDFDAWNSGRQLDLFSVSSNPHAMSRRNVVTSAHAGVILVQTNASDI